MASVAKLIRQQASGLRKYATEQQPPPPGTEPDPPKGPNQDVLAHVSEEAAEVAEITGEGGPDISQGTPIQEVLKRDNENTDKIPEIIKNPSSLKMQETETESSERIQALFNNMYQQQLTRFNEAEDAGLKFDMPELPLPAGSHLKHRYEPIIDQITTLLMVDGKKARARRNVSLILKHLQTAPAPRINPARPLLASTPPANTLPFQPIKYLQSVIDSVAPVLRIRSQKGQLGGGQVIQMPVPMTLRQRRRKAFMWILETASKKRSQGSGKGQLAKRVADEIIAVAEGRSGAWDKRNTVHKAGITSRGNLKPVRRRR